MDTHVSGYGAAAKTAPNGSAAREPKTPSTRFVVALLLSFSLLGLVVVQHPLLFGDQVIDVSAKTGDADPDEVKLPVSTKTAVKVSALSKLMHQLDKSSNCWLRDLGLSTSCHTTNDKADIPAVVQLRLRATGKNDAADTHECLSLLMMKKKKASADAKASGDMGGGDVSACDKSTCKQCMETPLSSLGEAAANTHGDELGLKHYIDSSAEAAVYTETHPDILPYLASTCPLASPAELPCLERLLDKRVSETKAEAQGVQIEGETTADLIAKCGSVEKYVNILAAHQAETDLQKFIKDTAVVTAYEEKNPSIIDYTDGTCPLASATGGTQNEKVTEVGPCVDNPKCIAAELKSMEDMGFGMEGFYGPSESYANDPDACKKYLLAGSDGDDSAEYKKQCRFPLQQTCCPLTCKPYPMTHGSPSEQAKAKEFRCPDDQQ